MGFFIAEPLEFPEYGLSVSECYVTIKAAYTCSKLLGPYMTQNYDPNMKYIATASWFIYSNKECTSYLAQKHIAYVSETTIVDPIGKLYGEIKKQFAGKSIVDDT